MHFEPRWLHSFDSFCGVVIHIVLLGWPMWVDGIGDVLDLGGCVGKWFPSRLLLARWSVLFILIIREFNVVAEKCKIQQTVMRHLSLYENLLVVFWYREWFINIHEERKTSTKPLTLPSQEWLGSFCICLRECVCVCMRMCVLHRARQKSVCLTVLKFSFPCCLDSMQKKIWKYSNTLQIKSYSYITRSKWICHDSETYSTIC